MATILNEFTEPYKAPVINIVATTASAIITSTLELMTAKSI
ncbi:hypothetical protein [Gracilimonas sp.]